MFEFYYKGNDYKIKCDLTYVYWLIDVGGIWWGGFYSRPCVTGTERFAVS
jgi:hypothetical protein